MTGPGRFISAPLDKRRLRMVVWPFSQARKRAVYSSYRPKIRRGEEEEEMVTLFLRFISAPLSSSKETIWSFPFMQACIRGVS
jgi:hypothetical protein